MLAPRVMVLPIAILLLCGEIWGDSDLRSALDAIDRRQRELAEYEEAQQYGFPYDQLDDLAFLNNPADGRAYEKDYLDDDNYDSYNKKLTSSFRERLEEDREKQMEELARNIYNNLESSGFDKNNLRELWERYYGNGINYVNNAIAKRYYPLYGLRNLALRKRDEEEPVYTIHHHVPRTDGTRHLRRTPYEKNKIFYVSKRSSPYTMEEKRSVKKQTDPKVEKDLNNIFGNDQKEIDDNKLGEGVSTTAKPTENPTTKKIEPTPPPRKIEKKDKPKMDAAKESELNKEVFAPVVPPSTKHLNLKKKSIDWSDYFGLDRRKKSDNGLDKEWLMERYHKAIAITAKKRNADLPLQAFKNRDNAAPSKDNPHGNEERKIEEMDKKLEKLEDELVESTLKYTGAHQDETNVKEVQQIKDNIISGLARAYNIEKMRNALEEYKMEIEKARNREDEKVKNAEKANFGGAMLEEKRVSVPRKEAVDDGFDAVVDADNNIKCTSGDDCHEQNYKLPSDILDTHFSNLEIECPAIERACTEITSMIGYYGRVFEPACHIHQMCLLCSNNSWFSPTRQCNALFLTKAYELCLGKEECKKEAGRSVRYLLEMNKSLQAQTALSDQCELQCPDIMSK